MPIHPSSTSTSDCALAVVIDASLEPSTNCQMHARREQSCSVQGLKAIDERMRSSRGPSLSPALSESGFSVNTPATPGSTTFHLEAHHRFPFSDEAFTPELGASAAAATSADSEERTSTDEPACSVVYEAVRDHEDCEPYRRAGTPPFSPSQASFVTDRLSVQSTTYTDFSTCSPSPSPSIGSVRMATITKIPARAGAPLRDTVHSVLSESVEDALEETEGTVWDAQVLSGSVMLGVKRPTDDCTADQSDHVNSDRVLEAAVSLHGEAGTIHASAVDEQRVLPKSTSAQTQLTVESWKENLDAAIDQISHDPAVTPAEDAMRRLKSILGPKTRIISRAPWDLDAASKAGETAVQKPIAGRRSYEALGSVNSAGSHPSTGGSISGVATAGRQCTRSHSVNTLLLSRELSAAGERDCSPSLAGLGIGLESSPVLSSSDSRRSLRSLRLSPSTQFGIGEPLPDVAGASLAAYAGRAAARPLNSRSGSSGRVTKTARAPTLALCDKLRSTADVASSSYASPPTSAPPTISLFAHSQTLPMSMSKASLPTSLSSAPSSSPSSSTPIALHALASSPASSASYFSAIPGATFDSEAANATMSRFSGHRLISLEDAQQRERERSAAAQRKAASTPPLETVVDRNSSRYKDAHMRSSTSESLSSRRGVQGLSAVLTGSPKAGLPPKALKLKKSGFLKRMMGGGGDKHSDRPLRSPDSLRPSLPSSASIPSLGSATPASTLGRSTGVDAAESMAHSTSSGQIAAFPASLPAQRERIRPREPFPALSLRPVSMAFSAGLPSDFLATMPSPILEQDMPSPSLSAGEDVRLQGEDLSPALRSVPLPAVPEPLASPCGASFTSGVSPVTPSILFEGASAWASGATTPGTPFFGGISSSYPSDAPATPLRLATLQDEYATSQRAWSRKQHELESQVRALEDELQRLRASAEKACSKCGMAKGLDNPVLQRSRVTGSDSILIGTVMMLASKVGLSSQIDLDYSVKAFPTTTHTPHSHLVPHGKIPALVISPDTSSPAAEHPPHGETVLYGSENICAYLDHLAGSKALPPHGTLERFEALTTEALASAIKDAALALRYERLERPNELLWQDWVTGQLSKITRSIPVLSKRRLPDPTSEVLGLDGIAVAIALWYVDRRAADAGWRGLEGGDRLNKWFEQVKQRPSWRATPFVK